MSGRSQGGGEMLSSPAVGSGRARALEVHPVASVGPGRGGASRWHWGAGGGPSRWGWRRPSLRWGWGRARRPAFPLPLPQACPEERGFFDFRCFGCGIPKSSLNMQGILFLSRVHCYCRQFDTFKSLKIGHARRAHSVMSIFLIE